VGTNRNTAFPLGRLFQWELRSRCQKSEGTEFPCVPSEITPWSQVQILGRTCLPCPIAIDALATDKNMLASFCGARCILFCWMVNGRQHETREHLRCRGVVGCARYLVWKLVLRFPASVPIHQDGIQGTSVLCYGRPK